MQRSTVQYSNVLYKTSDTRYFTEAEDFDCVMQVKMFEL